MPGVGQIHALRCSQGGAVFDEVGRALKAHGIQDPYRVDRERPATRPQFGVHGFLGLARAHPDVCERCTHHFPEHLRDFGCGREVALLAQRIARSVIMRVADRHIFVDPDAALGLDPRSQFSDETHATLSLPSVGSTRWRRFCAVSMTARPPTIIGTESHCPIERPLASANSVRCRSGRRTNSIRKRKTP